MRNMFLYFIGNIEFFYIRIVYFSLQFLWFVIISYMVVVENIYFLESISGILIFVGSTYLYVRNVGKLSDWFRWYFVRHSLAVLDNLPEAIGFNMKRMGTELFGKKQGWNTYNELKGYSSDTLRMWIMFGKYKILWKTLGQDFNFEISYLSKAWFDEHFVGLTRSTLPVNENFTTQARKDMSKGKRYDMLYKYDLIDNDGLLKRGEKKY